jgi:hypothetical protein
VESTSSLDRTHAHRLLIRAQTPCTRCSLRHSSPSDASLGGQVASPFLPLHALLIPPLARLQHGEPTHEVHPHASCEATAPHTSQSCNSSPHRSSIVFNSSDALVQGGTAAHALPKDRRRAPGRWSAVHVGPLLERRGAREDSEDGNLWVSDCDGSWPCAGAERCVHGRTVDQELTRTSRLVMAAEFKLNFNPENSDSIDALHERVANRIHDLCVTNGGLYIKIAQSIAIQVSRSGLDGHDSTSELMVELSQTAVLPKPYRDAFGSIFDAAPSVSFDEVVKVSLLVGNSPLTR